MKLIVKENLELPDCNVILTKGHVIEFDLMRQINTPDDKEKKVFEFFKFKSPIISQMGETLPLLMVQQLFPSEMSKVEIIFD